MSHWKVGRWMLSLVAVVTALSPYAADMNKTHMYNPKWSPHAKYHTAQTMLLGSLLGLSSLYFLWRKRGDQRLQLQVSALLASLFWISQAGSIFFPGADFFDPEYADQVPKVSGIRFNQAMIDGLMLLLIAIAYFLEQRRMKATLT
jgi:hypothetical protein